MSQTPDRHGRLRAVFDEALLREPSAREAYVAHACAGDPGLGPDVMRLLGAHQDARSFLEHPPDLLLSAVQSEEPFSGTERFRVVRRLGAGGMGVVYEAHDRVRDEVVALKTLRRAGAADLYRLKREFRSLADVAHANLVCLYELFVEDDRCFFTMELVDGVSFVDYARGTDRTSRFDDRLIDALRQLVDGVSALHRRSKLHRDIKPSNVLVTPEGRVVLLDFGLIAELLPRHADEAGHVGGGTPAYMAPEEASGARPSEAGDWYGIGVTLYEALTGTIPFTGPIPDVLLLKSTCDPPPPADIAPDVPNDLSGICMGLLCRDPARRLSGGDVLRELSGGDMTAVESPRSPPGYGEPSFVGRERQLDMLNGAFIGASQGRAGVVCIHGPSGIGKSALAQRFLDQMVERDDVVVLRGRCHEHESVPYKALDGVIDSLSQYLGALPRSQVETLVPGDVRALSRLFPVMLQVHAVAAAPRLEPEAPDPLVLRQRAFSSLRGLLTRLADRQPLVLYIDDLHWADADSALLLEELLRPPQPPPLLMLTCVRTEEIASKAFLQTFLERAGADSGMAVPLEPLTEDEARMLVASLVPEDSLARQARTLEIVQEAGGHPFLLEQLARYLVFTDTERERGATLAEMLDGRVRALPQGARRFLETLAICGRPVAPEVVFEACGLAGDERPLVARLRADRFLRSSGSARRVEIYHDRIRETVAAWVSPEGERGIHGLMARTLVARGADDPEALYAHYRGAGDREAASTQAALAARKADAALAFDRAAWFYRCALELAPDSPDRFGWKEGLAGALTNGGRPTDAAGVYLDAAGAADPKRRVELLRRGAEQMLIGGHIDRGLEIIRTVLSEMGVRLATSRRMALASLVVRRAQLRWRGLEFVAREADRIAEGDLLRIDTCWSVTTGLLLVDTVRAADFQTRHLLLALDAGEPNRIARGLALEVAFSAIVGGPGMQRTAALIERVRTIAGRVGHPHAIALSTLVEGIAAFMVGHWSKAARLCDRALGSLRDECVGVTWELACAQSFLLSALVYQGEVHDVSCRLPTLLASALEHGNLYVENELRTRMILAWLTGDDPDEVERQADDVIERWSHEGFHRQHFNHVATRIQIELYRGNAQAAWHWLTENWTAVRRSLLLRNQWVRIEASYAWARCALLMAASGRDTRSFLSVARDEARRIERERMPWSDPLASLLGAAVEYVGGNPGLAEGRLTRAVEGFELAGMKLYAAAARRRLGALLRGDGGRELMRQADEWMAAQGIRNADGMTRLLAPGFTDLS